MKIEQHVRGRTAVLALHGEVDLKNAQLVRGHLVALMAEKRPVVVDLSAVTYIDSSGLSCLIEAHLTARKQNTRFVLAATSAPALRVIQMARLDRVFALVSSVESAPTK